MNKIRQYLGYTFYALDSKQIDTEVKKSIGRIEAILFNRKDIEEDNWNNAWKNIEKAVNIYGANNVSFHFPVDDCDYIKDKFVRERLIEAINRAACLGIRVVVLHANQRLPLNEWSNVDLKPIRRNFIDNLYDIVDKTDKGTIVGLENMPPIGNLNDDADPLFIFPADFEEINNSRIKITFDINHYFNVVATMKECLRDNRLIKFLPNVSLESDFYDFKKIRNNIVHWHFSAFDNIANPITNQISVEGCCPWMSQAVQEANFIKAAKFIIENNNTDNPQSVIFEVTEEDYTKRINSLKIADWFVRQGE